MVRYAIGQNRKMPWEVHVLKIVNEKSAYINGYDRNVMLDDYNIIRELPEVTEEIARLKANAG